MLDLKILKIQKGLVKKNNPIKRFRFLHQQNNKIMGSNLFHFLVITEKNSDFIGDNIIDVHKIFDTHDENRLEIGTVLNREENSIEEINLNLLKDNHNYIEIMSSSNLQELMTIATIKLNENSEDLFYLDMVEYYGVVKQLQALKIDNWDCEISHEKKSIRLTAETDNLFFEYYLILRTNAQ